MKKKVLALSLTLLLILVLFSGCTSEPSKETSAVETEKPTTEEAPATEEAANTEEVTEKRTDLVIYDSSEWIGADMLQVDSWPYSQQILADPLFFRDPETGETLPNIISEFSISEDGKIMRMTLPEGLRYADGVSVEPEDVIASLLHGRENSSFAYGYDGIIDMEVDGRDIVCTLSGYRSDLEYFLADSFVGVISKEKLDTMSKEELLWGAMPYGPYYITEFSPGSHVDLAVNPYYKTHKPVVENKGVPHIENIRVTFAGEAFTVQQALINGDIDLIMSVTMEQYHELQGVEGIVTPIASGATIGYMELNADNEHLSDLRVRQAINYAIDREDIAFMTNESVVPSYSLVYKTVQNFSQDAWDYFEENYANDPEKSIELLEEAGYVMGNDGYYQKDGKPLSFVFKVRDTGDSSVAAQAMQLHLKEIGVKMTIEEMDWSYVNEAVVSGDFELGFLSLGWSESILLLNRFTRGPASNPDPDTYYAMVEECVTEIDYDKRSEIVGELQKMLFDYGTVVPLYSPVSYCAYRTNLKGLIMTEKADLLVNDLIIE